MPCLYSSFNLCSTTHLISASLPPAFTKAPASFLSFLDNKVINTEKDTDRLDKRGLQETLTGTVVHAGLHVSCYRQLYFASKCIAPVILYPYRLFQKKQSPNRQLLSPVRGNGSGLPYKALAGSWCPQKLPSEHTERFVRHEKVMAKEGLSVEGESLI